MYGAGSGAAPPSAGNLRGRHWGVRGHPLIHRYPGARALSQHLRVPALRSRVPVEGATRFVRSAGWVVFDQALISASNFFGMVVAARVLTTADFGTYALAYTAMWALNGLQSSLITQPHSVLASHTDLHAYRRFTSATGLMQLALCFALGIPFLLAGVVAMVAGAGPALIALGFALVTWQAQEFLRRVLYFESRLKAVVVLDVISYGGQLGAIVALAAAGSFTVASGRQSRGSPRRWRPCSASSSSGRPCSTLPSVKRSA